MREIIQYCINVIIWTAILIFVIGLIMSTLGIDPFAYENDSRIFVALMWCISLPVAYKYPIHVFD
jgi:hypothetical protein